VRSRHLGPAHEICSFEIGSLRCELWQRVRQEAGKTYKSLPQHDASRLSLVNLDYLLALLSCLLDLPKHRVKPLEAFTNRRRSLGLPHHTLRKANVKRKRVVSALEVGLGVQVRKRSYDSPPAKRHGVAVPDLELLRSDPLLLNEFDVIDLVVRGSKLPQQVALDRLATVLGLIHENQCSIGTVTSRAETPRNARMAG
jgi:hypothetical protein